MSVVMPLIRSLEFERGATEQACKGVCDPSRVIAHAENRAGGYLSGQYVRDPMHVATDRDRRREVREELADARNHLLWDMQTHLEDDERCHADLIALRHICLAYTRLLEER